MNRHEHLVSMYPVQVKRIRRAVTRARQKGLPATLSIQEWLQTLEDFEWACAYCGGAYHSLDHFLPLAAGGGTLVTNCVPSCLSCNSIKGSRLPEYCPLPLERITLVQSYLCTRTSKEQDRQDDSKTTSTTHQKGLSTMKFQEAERVQTNSLRSKTVQIIRDGGDILLQVQTFPSSPDDIRTPIIRFTIPLTLIEASQVAQDLIGEVAWGLQHLPLPHTQQETHWD